MNSPCYMGRCPGCNQVVALTLDKPEYRKDTAQEVAEWIRDGLAVERSMSEDELREMLAAYSHDKAWAGWMRYMFSNGYDLTGEWVMPVEYVGRWQRQMNTPYAELSEGEKASDREQADMILAIVGRGELQPDWADAPDWAQWWAVDGSGATWFEYEPIADRGGDWTVGNDWDDMGQWTSAGDVDIPLGVDWRLLKERRPQQD